MINCKEEFLNHVKEKQVLCAIIFKDDCDDVTVFGLLPVNFLEEELNLFLKNIDFTYDNGYGSQEIFGTIWYKDGTYSERFEYDGSESWSYKETPSIPELLKRRL